MQRHFAMRKGLPTVPHHGTGPELDAVDHIGVVPEPALTLRRKLYLLMPKHQPQVFMPHGRYGAGIRNIALRCSHSINPIAAATSRRMPFRGQRCNRRSSKKESSTHPYPHPLRNRMGLHLTSPLIPEREISRTLADALRHNFPIGNFVAMHS
ncbi:hypothetical protein Cenrod_1422 [Candidatus Symbiobacter mobilis CR]|uniref:Uncharacterized protein n=1 Tax=Candidatus Symbiobacter mobilis CR TaxID=946483 RepID=U5NBF9_9BURK|nr:hypothetical protein Cenrod_1422 [Candidatus Symbiobacter mobilis CR]